MPDCEHEIKPVTAGHRLCLTYNLLFTGDGPPPPAIPGGGWCCHPGRWVVLRACIHVYLFFHVGACPHLCSHCGSCARHVRYDPLHPCLARSYIMHAAYTARMVGLAQEWAADEEAPMKLLYVLSHR